MACFVVFLTKLDLLETCLAENPPQDFLDGYNPSESEYESASDRFCKHISGLFSEAVKEGDVSAGHYI